MSEDLRAYFAAEVPLPDWTEPTAVIDYIVDYERQLEAAQYFDEAHVRALVERVVARTNDMAASVLNHALAEEGELARGRLDEIAAPTLVIHGTADPLFPYGHAEVLAREIPRAELLPLEGVGHQVPPAMPLLVSCELSFRELTSVVHDAGYDPWTGLADDVRLGVLTEWVTAELVDEVLAECGIRDQRPGALPARFMVYYVLALALFQQAPMTMSRRTWWERWRGWTRRSRTSPRSPGPGSGWARR